MLSKKYRFPLKLEFSEFKKNTKHDQSSLFGLLYSENKKEISRFGFIISKKIDKRAVVRNRLKRVFSQVIADQLESVKPGYDFVFLVKRKAVDQEFSKIKEEIKNSFKKLNLYEKKSSKNN